MSVLRTIASALCIVLGALLIATWAASTAALSAIEEGTVIEDATTKAIATDAAQQELVTNGTEVVLGALDQAGINSNIPGIEAITREIVDAVVESDAFANAVHSQTRSVREQVVEALETPTTGPIDVTLDFSDEVNARLSQIPVIGGALPTVAVPGVPVQVMDTDTADTARNAWHWLHVAEAWFGWIGLAFITLGIIVSHRRRWFFAKVSLAVAVVSALVWLAMTALEAQTLASFIPGVGTVVDAVILEIVHGVQGKIAGVMGYVALGAMIGAAVLFILAARGDKGVEQ